MFLLFSPKAYTLWFNDHHVYTLPLPKSLWQSSAFVEWAQRRGLSPWAQSLPPSSLHSIVPSCLQPLLRPVAEEILILVFKKQIPRHVHTDP